MRPILFRGRTRNGVWVYGPGIRHRSREVQILSPDGAYTVAAGTVGQFTGKWDRNGQRVFEGDILSSETGEWEVCWLEKLDGWGRRSLSLSSPGLIQGLGKGGRVTGEVIGTVWDTGWQRQPGNRRVAARC